MHVDEDITRELVRQFFKLDSMQQKQIRKRFIPPAPVEKPEPVICDCCGGEGVVEVTCTECDGSGWLDYEEVG